MINMDMIELLTTNQAAELLKITPRAVARRIKQQQLDAQKIGQSWLVILESVKGQPEYQSDSHSGRFGQIRTTQKCWNTLKLKMVT